jgi:hypothetical protein
VGLLFSLTNALSNHFPPSMNFNAFRVPSHYNP